MDITKEQIEKYGEKLMKDKNLQAQFMKDPEKAVEKLIGQDIPDGMFDKVVKELQKQLGGKKLDADSIMKAAGNVDALKKLF